MPVPDAGAAPLDRRALGFVLVLASLQDVIFAILFLSTMNHYLLDVLKTSAGSPGYTLAIYGGTKLIAHPFAGRLIDRTSPRFVFVLAVGVQACALVLLLSTRGLGIFLIVAVLMAIGAAAFWPLIYEAVARTQPRDGHARAAGILALVGYISTAVGLGIGVLLADFAPWRAAFILALVLVALPFALQREPALRRLGPAPGDAIDPPAPRRGRRPFVVFGAVLFLDYACITAVAGSYGPYIRRTLDISLLHATILMVPAGAIALGSLALASRFSRPDRRFFEMAGLYAVAAVGAFALSATDAPVLAAVFAVIMAAGIGGISPIIAATMLDMGGNTSRGFVIGSLMSVEGLGSIAGPGVAAATADLFGPRAAMALIGSILVALVGLTLFASGHRNRDP